MVSFLVYDIAFLIIFSIAVAWFIIKMNRLPKKKNPLSREGIIFMYRTKWGIKFINYIGDNYKKILQLLVWPIIILGSILMVGIMWMLGKTLSVYVLFPQITDFIKAPPIAPLIPYFPKLFGMENFFPPFYFTYFIVALAIVAIVHEFSHGIFMRLFKVKIKSTGIVFLGPILGAFVEEERKGFEKKKKTDQMAILGAGVFANTLFALIFYLLYVLFFFISFSPTGYQFDSYGVSVLPLENITGFEEYGNLTKVMTRDKDYYLDSMLMGQLEAVNNEYIIAYPESPAVLLQLGGAITRMDDSKILNQQDLQEFMNSKEPGDRVEIVTLDMEGIEKAYSAPLGARPDDESRAYLGVGNSQGSAKGIFGAFFNLFMGFKDPTTYYTPTWDGDFVYFIYHLLWWVMIINLLVALFNMLPLGMLDGGRFFYLAVWGLTKSEKVAKSAYKVMKYVILMIFLLLMFFWFVRII